VVELSGSRRIDKPENPSTVIGLDWLEGSPDYIFLPRISFLDYRHGIKLLNASVPFVNGQIADIAE
jgi:hypothetical protein